MTEGTYDLDFDTRNLPRKTFILEYSADNYELNATCDFLWGTSTAPSLLSGLTADKYTVRIKSNFPNKNGIADFYIHEYDFIWKMIFRKQIKIKSKDKYLSSQLHKSSLVQDIYKHCKDSAELSPMIECHSLQGVVHLDINYQSFEINLDILESAIEFSNSLKKNTTKPNTTYSK